MTQSAAAANRKKPWCIVVADDHGPEFVPTIAGAGRSAPVQYCGFGESTTLLQKALHRARRIAPAAQIAVTVREEDRDRWEPALWFTSPERRFVSDHGISPSLTMAAALLSIAADSVSNVVTILPARCYVAHEWILSAAIDRLHEMLPRIPEGVGTLGMIEIDDGIDEDLLVPGGMEFGPGLSVRAMARRPVSWIAGHLRQHGAMVASGILTGYAGVFASHVSKQRPGLTKAIAKGLQSADNGEIRLGDAMWSEVPRSVQRSLRWWPPTFPQRAFRVHRCGYRGLRTARAIARICVTCPATFDSAARQSVARDFQGEHLARSRAKANSRGDVDHGWLD